MTGPMTRGKAALQALNMAGLGCIIESFDHAHTPGGRWFFFSWFILALPSAVNAVRQFPRKRDIEAVA